MWIGEIIGRIGNWIINGKDKTMLITPEQLDAVTSTLSKERCVVMATLIDVLCKKYGIIEKLPFRMFLANVIQESGEFNHKEENMNYSAGRLMAVWPSRFKTLAEAAPYARNPEKLANLVYGGRMGNNQPGDGSKFKGRAFIGITGRELYTKYAAYLGKPIDEVTELMEDTDEYALDTSCWFFAILKKLIPVAKAAPTDKKEKDNFKKVCQLINGGFIGYDVRLKYYNKINQVLA